MDNTIKIEFRGEYLDVMFDYTQGENQVVHYGDGSGYPGSRSKVVLTQVMFQDTDLTWLLEDNDRVKELVLEALED